MPFVSYGFVLIIEGRWRGEKKKNKNKKTWIYIYEIEIEHMPTLNMSG